MFSLQVPDDASHMSRAETYNVLLRCVSGRRSSAGFTKRSDAPLKLIARLSIALCLCEGDISSSVVFAVVDHPTLFLHGPQRLFSLRALHPSRVDPGTHPRIPGTPSLFARADL